MSALHNRIAGINNDSDNRPVRWGNTRESFGLLAQLFHTILGIAIILMLIVGFLLDSLPMSARTMGYMLHMGLGLWILLGSILWFASRLFQPTPAPLPNQSRGNYRVAKLVHRLLLLLCIAMPVTGWIMASAWGNAYFTVAPFIHIPAVTYKDPDFAKAMLGLHIVIAWMIIGLLVLHIAGALYHHLVKRDPLLRRILPHIKRIRGHHRFQFDKGVHKNKSMR